MTYDLMNRRDTITKHHAGIESSVETIRRYIEVGIPPRKAVLGFGFYVKWFETVPLKELDGSGKGPIGIPTVQMEDLDTGKDLGVSGAFVWCEKPGEKVKASFELAMAGGMWMRGMEVITSWMNKRISFGLEKVLRVLRKSLRH